MNITALERITGETIKTKNDAGMAAMGFGFLMLAIVSVLVGVIANAMGFGLVANHLFAASILSAPFVLVSKFWFIA